MDLWYGGIIVLCKFMIVIKFYKGLRNIKLSCKNKNVIVYFLKMYICKYVYLI